MKHTTIISAAELAQHVFTPNWIVLDCRHDLANPNAGIDAFRAAALLAIDACQAQPVELTLAALDAEQSMLQQRIEIGHIIWKPVRVASARAGQAETAPVGRNHMPVARQRIDDELKRRRHIHPSMQHEDDGCALPSPMADMKLQAAHGDEFGTGRCHR